MLFSVEKPRLSILKDVFMLSYVVKSRSCLGPTRGGAPKRPTSIQSKRPDLQVRRFGVGSHLSSPPQRPALPQFEQRQLIPRDSFFSLPRLSGKPFSPNRIQGNGRFSSGSESRIHGFSRDWQLNGFVLAGIKPFLSVQQIVKNVRGAG
jgi:hypothetical protein